MPDGSIVVYVYDGTYEGMLNCIFTSFERHEIPSQILTHSGTLLPMILIDTDLTKATRVEAGIVKKLGGDALIQVRHLFLTCLEDKELTALNYVRTGFSYGKRFYAMLDEPSVFKANKAVKYLLNETHRMKEFARFSDYGGVLAAIIEPLNVVLPLISRHFTDRYPNERFLIFDKAHQMALLYADRQTALLPMEELSLPAPSADEQKFRRLWKLFYDTIEIKPRHNERTRMGHMPKRYWHNLTEFAGTPYGGGAFGGRVPQTAVFGSGEDTDDNTKPQ